MPTLADNNLSRSTEDWHRGKLSWTIDEPLCHTDNEPENDNEPEIIDFGQSVEFIQLFLYNKFLEFQVDVLFKLSKQHYTLHY